MKEGLLNAVRLGLLNVVYQSESQIECAITRLLGILNLGCKFNGKTLMVSFPDGESVEFCISTQPRENGTLITDISHKH